MMRERNILFIFLMQCLFAHLPASNLKLEYNSRYEERFFEYWQENLSSSMDTLTAWLIADGVKDSSEIASLKNIYNKLLSEMKSEINSDNDPEEKAEIIFNFLHKKILKQSREDAKLKNILLNGTYNTVTGSGLYYLCCKNFGLPVEIRTSPFYCNNRIKINQKIIDIDITDKKNGFDKKVDKEDILLLLVKLGIIEEKEYENKNIDELFEQYINYDESLNPYKLMGVFYHKDGILSLQSGNFESALNCFEKALVINPDNEIYKQNYKYTLYNISQIISPFEQFMPKFDNALWLLKNDPSFVDYAILMSGKAIQYYADDLKDHQKAADLVLQYKTTYLNEKFLKMMNEMEENIEFEWALYLASRGDYESSYVKIINLYSRNPSLPKYKDMYVDITLMYAKNLVYKAKNYKRANLIMDSLYTVAKEYSIVEDAYIAIILAPIQLEYGYINNSPQAALALAKRAYEISPEHNISKNAISRVYHELAMGHVRKNNLKQAHRILAEGLGYIPDDNLLNEDIKQVEEKY